MSAVQPIRVAFAGLAHSHPFSDAANLVALRERGEHVEFAGVYDTDETLVASFAKRFGCPVASDLATLCAAEPDLVIVTARAQETAPYVRQLLSETGAMLFANKVVAGTTEQLREWEAAVASAPERVGSCSVLRFAPALRELASRAAGSEIWGVRVLAQHDIEMFLAPDRAWQDDPSRGGGTLVTVGLHAWEMIGAVLPGAALDGDVSGWIHRSPNATTVSEEAAQLSGALLLPAGGATQFAITVTGTPGPEEYAIDVFTAQGTHSVSLAFPHPSNSLGFVELAEALLANSRARVATAPWESARPIVSNTLRAAQALRAAHHTETSQR